MEKGIRNLGVLCGILVRTVFRKRPDAKTQELAQKSNQEAEKLVLKTLPNRDFESETEVLGKANNQNARAREVRAKYFYGSAGGFMPLAKPKTGNKDL